MARAQYILIGGFLGAGKTTAMVRFGAYLAAAGRRVGLITNDQSSGLADTRIVEHAGFPVREITGGCFCCRFNSLTAAAEQLAAEAAPDVFLAEPVGSCTDLRASVQYPLRRLYGDNYRIGPLSVLVDPVRALRILGLEPGKAFSRKVQYVYRKQLEEAELIVINKCDLLDATRRSQLEDALHAAFPAAEVFLASARTGAGLERWFARVIDVESDARPAPAVDYDTYAEGEALLGWFNGTFRLETRSPFDGNRFLLQLAHQVRHVLAPAQPEIAHFKMTLVPSDEGGDMAALNLVGTDREPELSHALEDDMRDGELIVNLRAESDPERLRGAIIDSLAAVTARHGIACEPVHMEHFRPARPSPTHRMATVET